MPDGVNYSEHSYVEIGCGGDGVKDLTERDEPYLYEPWGCRAAANEFGEVLGIDIAAGCREDKKVYKHLQSDIVPYILSGRLHELITSQVGKPVLMIVAENIFSDHLSPSLDTQGIDIEDLTESFIAQALKLVSDNGIVVVGNDIYTN